MSEVASLALLSQRLGRATEAGDANGEPPRPEYSPPVYRVVPGLEPDASAVTHISEAPRTTEARASGVYRVTVDGRPMMCGKRQLEGDRLDT
jgi:hypothetical protein